MDKDTALSGHTDSAPTLVPPLPSNVPDDVAADSLPLSAFAPNNAVDALFTPHFYIALVATSSSISFIYTDSYFCL